MTSCKYRRSRVRCANTLLCRAEEAREPGDRAAELGGMRVGMRVEVDDVAENGN